MLSYIRVQKYINIGNYL